MRRRITQFAVATGWVVALVAGTVTGQSSPADAPPTSQPPADQHPDDEPQEPSRRDLAPDFWPSQQMVERRFRRTAEWVARHYELDDAQHARLESMLLERWPTFLDENKKEIQGLVGEMLRSRFRGEKPSPERIADFGRRVMPLYQKLRTNIEESGESFRKTLRPEQQRQFDADIRQARAGLDVGARAIRDMQQGIFDPPGWRERFATVRRNNDRAGRAGRGPGLSGWQRYTDRFIRRHRLDEAQKTAALAILDDLQTRRQQHETVVADTIARIQERIASVSDASEQAEAEKQLAEVQAPVREMASELHRRLDTLLTDAQRTPAPAPEHGQAKSDL